VYVYPEVTPLFADHGVLLALPVGYVQLKSSGLRFPPEFKPQVLSTSEQARILALGRSDLAPHTGDVEAGHEVLDGADADLGLGGLGHLWIGVHLDDHAVGADARGGERERLHAQRTAGAVGWIDHHRKMGRFLEGGDGADVE